MPALAQGLLRRIADSWRRLRLPRVVTLYELDPRGCRFEIATPVEVYRVEHYGGEQRFTSEILAGLSTEDTLYDIGASIGMVSVHAAIKGVGVVAFEPDVFCRSRLEKNLELNGVLGGVRIVEWAVCDSAGNATLYVDRVRGDSPSLRGEEGRDAVAVRTDSLDRALARRELPNPTVIKIDIEGAEMLALRGMRDLLRAPHRPRLLFLEIHPAFLPAFGSSATEVETYLRALPYRQEQRLEAHNQIHGIYRAV